MRHVRSRLPAFPLQKEKLKEHSDNKHPKNTFEECELGEPGWAARSGCRRCCLSLAAAEPGAALCMLHPS